MEIFVYSDESGVFDVKHNKYYVYSEVIFLNKNNKDVEKKNIKLLMQQKSYKIWRYNKPKRNTSKNF